MSDNQFNVLIGALVALAGSIGATVRWAVNRFALTIDRGSEAMMKALDANTIAMIANTKANARLEVKIEAVAEWVEGHPTPPLGTQLVDLHPPRELPRVATPGRGVPAREYGPPRSKTRNEDR